MIYVICFWKVTVYPDCQFSERISLVRRCHYFDPSRFDGLGAFSIAEWDATLRFLLKIPWVGLIDT